jgi:hypothetical protein
MDVGQGPNWGCSAKEKMVVSIAGNFSIRFDKITQ